MTADNSFDLPSIVDGEDKSSPIKNCIRNNYRHIRKWAKRTQTNCFRLYDRDMHDYPLAIDFYDGRFFIHYFPRSRDEQGPNLKLIQEITDVLSSLFQVNMEMIYWRTRTKHKPTRQYEKLGESKEFFVVKEYGVNFRVNLLDYLDTGLFLDHRETRQIVAHLSKGKRVLNLFAYTCAFGVQAAAVGALYTKNVDLSNTYTAWGRENFILNHLDAQHHAIVRADCLQFLYDEERSGEKYDLIVIDPPTISRSNLREFVLKIMIPSLFNKFRAFEIKKI